MPRTRIIRLVNAKKQPWNVALEYPATTGQSFKKKTRTS